MEEGLLEWVRSCDTKERDLAFCKAKDGEETQVVKPHTYWVSPTIEIK